jgi:hypothetical protein
MALLRWETTLLNSARSILLLPAHSNCSSASGPVNPRAALILRRDGGFPVPRMKSCRVRYYGSDKHSIYWRSVMTLKLLAPLALLFGILGGGVSGAKMSCCSPNADCCNPPQACCLASSASVKATDCCPDSACCNPPQECCGFVSTKAKVSTCCNGGDCCDPAQECCQK